MTNKTTMPEPVAYMHVSRYTDRKVISKRKDKPKMQSKGFISHGLITTWQAEAYANAMVREALEKAAQACEARIGTGDADVDTIDFDIEAQECAAAIRS